jgi:hypothetical protein
LPRLSVTALLGFKCKIIQDHSTYLEMNCSSLSLVSRVSSLTSIYDAKLTHALKSWRNSPYSLTFATQSGTKVGGRTTHFVIDCFGKRPASSSQPQFPARHRRRPSMGSFHILQHPCPVISRLELSDWFYNHWRDPRTEISKLAIRQLYQSRCVVSTVDYHHYTRINTPLYGFSQLIPTLASSSILVFEGGGKTGRQELASNATSAHSRSAARR